MHNPLMLKNHSKQNQILKSWKERITNHYNHILSYFKTLTMDHILIQSKVKIQSKWVVRVVQLKSIVSLFCNVSSGGSTIITVRRRRHLLADFHHHHPLLASVEHAMSWRFVIEFTGGHWSIILSRDLRTAVMCMVRTNFFNLY